MTRLFPGQERHRLAYHRIGFLSRTALNRARSHTLGLHSLGPYGQAVEQFEAGLIELRPLDSGRIEFDMRIDKESAEQFFVLLRTNRQRSRSAILIIECVGAIARFCICL